MPRLLVTGFGPFLDVAENPSGALARALAADPPAGLDVRARVLPVSVERAPAELDALVAEAAAGGPPLALCALGVHRGPGFRLERRARGVLTAEKPDVDGLAPAGRRLADGAERATTLDLAPLAAALAAAGADPVRVSDDAGGYVCERVYHHALGVAAALGAPAVFVHVPPAEEVPLARQLPPLRALLVQLAELAGGRRAGG